MGIKNLLGKQERKKNLKPAVLRYDVDEIKLVDLVGLSLKDAKEKYGDMIYLPEDDEKLIAKANNSKVNDDYIIQEMDEIVFVKESGRKG